VDVAGNILVPRGATLTVDPGTVVRFRAYQGYEEPERNLRLRVEGRILAHGSPGKMIRFTSSAPSPRNGDWSMVKLVRAKGSQISHAVFEYAHHGLNIWNTDISLRHIVIRYSNWEGLYVENNCRVELLGSRIYNNGYNCVAIEQQVDLRVERSYIANCGTLGIHVDASKAHISNSLIEGSQEGLSLDNDARVTAVANRFCAQKNAAVSCGEGKNQLRLGNNVWDGLPERLAVACGEAQQQRIPWSGDPPLDLKTGVREGAVAGHLPYIPGQRPQDRYRYIYPAQDATRAVRRKIGAGLGLTWSLTWDGEALWTANLDGMVFRLHPSSGEVLKRFKAPGPQPWGMAFDGELLWINDFARRKIHGVNPHTGAVVRRFNAPDPAGGCKGLTWDGAHLHALGWATHKLYTLGPTGEVLRAVPVPSRGLGGGVRIHAAGGLTWDGQSFWAPADRVLRFDRSGKLLGWIHATSERVWDLTWDGSHLWLSQRANENWNDIPRLFQVSVLQQGTAWKDVSLLTTNLGAKWQ